MLPDRTLQLLTAFVDGEISSRERKHVERLLRKSLKARTLVRLLQDDSRGVRDLTRLKLGPDFSMKVMRTIAQGRIRTNLSPRPAPAPPPWVGMAVAASVLVLISAASYWYFAPRLGVRVEGPSLVHRQPDPFAREGPFGRFGPGAISLAASELAAEATRTRLATELRKDSAYHVDLAVQDNARAVEHLTAALRHSGFKVLMASGTQKSLKQQQSKTSYVLFAENLRPEELAAILQQLGSSPRKEAKGNRQDVVVQQVLVGAMTPEDRQELSNLLSWPLGKLPTAAKGPSEPPAELVNKTIIAGDPKGQGSPPMPPKTAPQQAPDRFALVLALPQGALSGPADSPELRTFLSSRREPRFGTLQVLLVVHQAST